MIQRDCKPCYRSMLVAAFLLITTPVLSGCQQNSQDADPSASNDVQATKATNTNEAPEIDELAGIPDITMAELAESLDAETLYVSNCAKCHGLTGLGDGPSVGSLNTQHGLNLTILDDMSDAEIMEIISVGKGMEMPPWELLLSKQQLQGLTDYVRVLADS